ncbi:pogo transposable element with ZNF domain [Sarotherodon galilaeus]
MAASTDFQDEAAWISTFAGKTTNTMQPLQDGEPRPSMPEAPAENPRVHQSPNEAALCWSTDPGHLPEDDEQEAHDPDPPQDQPEVQEVKQGPAADDQEAGGQEQKEDRALPPDPDSNLTMGTANQDKAGESGGSMPSPVVTETEQRNTEMAAQGRQPERCSEPGPAVEEAVLQKAGRPSDLATFAAVSASRPTSGSDREDVTCCDLLSLKSDSVSLASESNVFRRVSERRRAGAFTQTSQLLGLVYTSPTAAPVRALLRVRESDSNEVLHKSASVHTETQKHYVTSLLTLNTARQNKSTKNRKDLL